MKTLALCLAVILLSAVSATAQQTATIPNLVGTTDSSQRLVVACESGCSAATTGTGTAAAAARVVEASDSDLAVDTAAIRTATEATASDIDTLLSDLATDAVHDNAAVAGGPQTMGEAKDFDGSALPNAVAEGDAARAAVTLTGSTFSFLVNEDGSKQLGKLEDDAHATADYALPVLSRRIDAAASSAGTDADYATVNTDALGLLWTRGLDPCSGVAKQYLSISISSATTTEITAALAGASNNYYVCSINIGPVAGAQTIALVDDDTDNCASVTSGLAGGITAGTGWNIAANGGLTMGNGLGSIARTAGTNRVLCLVTSAAVQTSGVITVVAAP
jgi:hypothetical protein